MIPIYIVSAIVGGGLVLVSALAGHGEHDAGHDTGGVDHGHDGQAEAHIWIPFLSLRFWTYFFVCFGVLGLLLTKVGGVVEPVIGLISGGTGIVVGTVVASLMRMARRMESDSSAKTQDFLGVTGKVIVTIRPGSAGKIRVNIKGDAIELLALPTENETLEIGTDAVIVTWENDRVRVMSAASLLEETLQQHA